MSLTSGFYPSRDGDRKYSAEQFGALFDGIITDGIMGTYSDRQLFVEAVGGQTLAIHPGRAWFNHTWVYNSTNYTINIDSSEPLLDRWDAVVLKIDRSTSVRRASFYVKKGTPASNPAKPVIDASTTVITHVALAYVNVKAGVSSITQGDVVWPAAGKASAFCTGPMQTMNVEQLQAQWKNQFTNWLNTKDTIVNSLLFEWRENFNNLYNQWRENFNNLYNTWGAENGNFERLHFTWSENFNRLYNKWTENFNNLYNTWGAEGTGKFDTLWHDWQNTFSILYNRWNNAFDTFMYNSENSFSAFMTRVDTAFDAFEAQKQQEIDGMLANLGSEFEDFWQEFKALMNNYLSGQETIWENWFSHIQGQLDEDAAGHLQDQIDALTYFYVIDRELVIPNNAGSVSGTELILGVPTLSVQVPAFAVNPNSGHLEYESVANFNVNDSSGHIEWDVN